MFNLFNLLDVQSETFIEQSCPDDLLHASSSTSVTITAIESTGTIAETCYIPT